jgi:hypothetical protein
MSSSPPGLTHSHGIDGDGPDDLVAGSGELSFWLRNDKGNSGSTLGYYSPGHASCRTGWDFGVQVRVVYTYSSTDYVRWIGKVATVEPTTAFDGAERVHVIAYDHQHDLIEAGLTTVSAQISQLGQHDDLRDSRCRADRRAAVVAVD